jgi:hypothetical protein
VKHLFVDTAGWMMLADTADPLHERARKTRDDWLAHGGFLVTTDYVADETFTLVRVRLGHDAAAAWWEQVEGSSRLLWEWIEPARFDRAREWYFKWRDQRFSFTDCTSFVVMREKRLSAALTSDRHFAAAGFTVVPAA